MSITSVGTPSPVTNDTGPTIASAWGTGQARTAGNLLCALVSGGATAGGSPTSTLFSGSGWTKRVEASQADAFVALWTLTALGADAAPGFSDTASGGHAAMSVTLFELTDSGGTTPTVDTSGTAIGTGSTLTTTTSGLVAATGEFALGMVTEGDTFASSSNTWGASAPWTNAFHDSSLQFWHWVVGTLANPSSGATLSYAPTWTATSNTNAGLVAVFKPGLPIALQNALMVF